LPRYVIVKEKYEVGPGRLATVFGALQTRWPDAVVNRLDGMRLDWPDRWLHIRASNTEPIIRVIAEAPNEDAAESLCREMGQIILENGAS
jgi:phosphomannomutase